MVEAVRQPPFAFELHRRNLRLYSSPMQASFGLGTTITAPPAYKLDTGVPAATFDRERGHYESADVNGLGFGDIWTNAADGLGARAFWRRRHILEALVQFGNPVNASSTMRAGIGLGSDAGVTPWPAGAFTTARIHFGIEALTKSWELYYRDGQGNDLVSGVNPVVPPPNAPSTNFYHLKIAFVPNEYIACSVNGIECIRLTPNDIPFPDPAWPTINGTGPSIDVHAGAGAGPGLYGRFAAVFNSVSVETFGTD